MHTQFISLTITALLEPVANIRLRALLIEGSFSLFSLVNSCQNRRAKLVSTVKKFFGKHHDLVDPYNVAFFLFDFVPSVEAN